MGDTLEHPVERANACGASLRVMGARPCAPFCVSTNRNIFFAVMFLFGNPNVLVLIRFRDGVRNVVIIEIEVVDGAATNFLKIGLRIKSEMSGEDMNVVLAFALLHAGMAKPFVNAVAENGGECAGLILVGAGAAERANVARQLVGIIRRKRNEPMRCQLVRRNWSVEFNKLVLCVFVYGEIHCSKRGNKKGLRILSNEQRQG